MGHVPASVMTTVNAPHSKKLSDATLAYYLKHPVLAVAVPGHMSAFFGDVKPDCQMAFAAAFEISDVELALAAKKFAAYSGESYPLAA